MQPCKRILHDRGILEFKCEHLLLSVFHLILDHKNLFPVYIIPSAIFQV